MVTRIGWRDAMSVSCSLDVRTGIRHGEVRSTVSTNVGAPIFSSCSSSSKGSTSIPSKSPPPPKSQFTLSISSTLPVSSLPIKTVSDFKQVLHLLTGANRGLYVTSRMCAAIRIQSDLTSCRCAFSCWCRCSLPC